VDTRKFVFKEPTMAKARPPQMVELVRAGRSPEELAQEFVPTAQSIRNYALSVVGEIGSYGATAAPTILRFLEGAL
jgi:hypothetical protein